MTEQTMKNVFAYCRKKQTVGSRSVDHEASATIFVLIKLCMYLYILYTLLQSAKLIQEALCVKQECNQLQVLYLLLLLGLRVTSDLVPSNRLEQNDLLVYMIYIFIYVLMTKRFRCNGTSYNYTICMIYYIGKIKILSE